ncbi:chemotaxis protein CheW [Solidesulfovibrio sp. C21]|uniref:chemotaxis protein CheW n=1 Tax=Solidesulfovibrio sp. C21 TaxID=3398613 RepID=UPI0039FCEC8A
MSGSLEEYFKDHVTLPEKGQEAFSDTERAFLARYMGEDFEAALSRQGLDRPARVETVAGALSPGPGGETGPAPEAAASAEDTDAALEAGLRQAETLKLVGFRLAGQELAVPIAQVQEVLRAMPVTRLPAAPPQILGILNLRGRVVPMVDLAAITELSGPRGENRFIIVCRCRGMLVGLMVEALSTMHQARGEDIEWGVEARLGVSSDLVSGLLKVGEGLVAILSVDSLFQKVLKS